MVIIHDENHPCSFWKLRRVTNLIKGDDGQISGAAIDVVTNGKPQTLQRPVTNVIVCYVVCRLIFRNPFKVDLESTWGECYVIVCSNKRNRDIVCT